VALAKTNVRVEGARGSREGMALVDACSSLTLLDAAVAAEVGVKLTGRTIKLAAGLPPKLKERLQALRLAEWCALGLSALRILGFVPSTAKEKEEKVEHLRYDVNRSSAANVR